MNESPRFTEFLDHLENTYGSIGGITSDIIYGRPQEVQQMLRTGKYVDIEDFRNASKTAYVQINQGKQALSATIEYLGQDLGKDFTDKLNNYMSGWANDPNILRERVILRLQTLVDMVSAHDYDTFDPGPVKFTNLNWQILRAVVQDVSYKVCGDCSIVGYLYSKGNPKPVSNHVQI